MLAHPSVARRSRSRATSRGLARGEWLLVAVIVGATLLGAVPGRAIEDDDPFDGRLPPEPQFAPDQRLLIGEPPDGGALAVAPRRVSVFFRRFEFDLSPSSLELWIDGVEHTESLRFWVDRAWLELPQSFTWGRGSHTVLAKIRDAAGATFVETNEFEYLPPVIPSGYPMPVDVSTISNLFEDYQDFTATPYWHSGVDIRTDAGTPVLASEGGVVVKVKKYNSSVLCDSCYWQVAVEANDGYVWQYHHLAPSTIAVAENDVVAAGDTLGRVTEWPKSINGAVYNHLHLNIVRWLGGGPIPGPYVDGFEYHNPLAFLDQPADADTVLPFLFDVWFTPNESDDSFVADSDPGHPMLTGDVDIVAKLEDLRTEVPAIAGHPYELGLYDLAYSVKPLTSPCSIGWIPRTTLARFDKIPGGTNVNTQKKLLLEIYKQIVFHGFESFTTNFNYSTQRFLYTMTNSFFGTVNADSGYWNTDGVLPLGPRFPDGAYTVTLYASDFDGNERTHSILVFLSNGLTVNGPCPNVITAASMNGEISLEKLTGASARDSGGAFPVEFGDVDEGSTFDRVGSRDWPAWHFDFPSEGIRVAIGVLDGDSAKVEYVPYLGDVILEVPAEAQVIPLGTGGAPDFDPSAPRANPVDLRLSTRLARHPLTGAALIGAPQPKGSPSFRLALAETLTVNGETMVLRTAGGAMDASWTLDLTGVAFGPPPPGPAGIRIAVSPNPFQARVGIGFTLPRAEDVRVDVLDLRGRRIRTLHQGRLDAGGHSWVWDGADERGDPQPPGVYFARVRAGDLTGACKVVRTR